MALGIHRTSYAADCANGCECARWFAWPCSLALIMHRLETLRHIDIAILNYSRIKGRSGNGSVNGVCLTFVFLFLLFHSILMCKRMIWILCEWNLERQWMHIIVADIHFFPFIFVFLVQDLQVLYRRCSYTGSVRYHIVKTINNCWFISLTKHCYLPRANNVMIRSYCYCCGLPPMKLVSIWSIKCTMQYK